MNSIGALIHELIGCDWGSKITAATDLSLCEVQAVQRLAFHDPAAGKVAVLKFCTKHLRLAKEMTDPHAG